MIATASGSRHSRVDYRALADFRHEIRRFLRVSEQAARGAGLEPQHHQLLLAIKGAPPGDPPTIAYLAERLQLRHHSIVGLVDRLEQRGLVHRRRDPADHRRALVSLTDAGEQILHTLSVLHQDEIRSRAAGLIAAMMPIVRAARTRK
ncbi:MAG TPA: MarR family transcriptional regulator [Gemmatimonadales bacterium]|jgi:DNA-binding MarR family transcriptional regulator|nr:MarR family transcriptional regulator [Gemmatimonadales bacterium]